MRQSMVWHLCGYLFIFLFCLPLCMTPARLAFFLPARAFDGASTGLRQTVIVPTLDTPSPPDRNVIWCASFPLAWRQAQQCIVHAPMQVVGAEDESRRLNAAPIDALNLDAHDYYATAGLEQEGIVSTIRREMASRFPAVPDAWLPADTHQDGIVAYGYLAARMTFDTPYPQLPAGCIFVNSSRARNHGPRLWEFR